MNRHLMVSRDRNVIQRAELIKKVLWEVRAVDNKNSILNNRIADPDEVYPGVFIGDEFSAKDKSILRYYQITHIVNAAAGKGFGMVNTGNSYYADLNISYLGTELSDLSVSDASQYFYETAEFIDEALQKNGKVFVHCQVGISRSSTLVLAFLIIKRGMSAVEAVTQVRRHRNIHPNDGFINQLAYLDLTLESIRAKDQNKMR